MHLRFLFVLLLGFHLFIRSVLSSSCSFMSKAIVSHHPVSAIPLPCRLSPLPYLPVSPKRFNPKGRQDILRALCFGGQATLILYLDSGSTRSLRSPAHHSLGIGFAHYSPKPPPASGRQAKSTSNVIFRLF
jgi:hypothetical protein